MRFKVLIFILAFYLTCAFSSGDVLFSLSAIPGADIPLPAEKRFVTTGGGIGLTGDLQLSFLPVIVPTGELGFDFLPIWTGDGVAVVTAGGGLSFRFTFLERFSASLIGTAGYYYGLIADGSGSGGGNMYLSGAGRIGFSISPALNIGVESGYRTFLDGQGGMVFHSLGLGISTRIAFLPAKRLTIEDTELQAVFPVLFKYYDKNSVGTVRIVNTGSVPTENIRVDFFVERYMDNPTKCPAPTLLDAGTSTEVDLFALFSDNVLEITEGTVASAKITVSYEQKDRPYTTEVTESIRLYDRNAITWDDDRKAAAYVTAKDPIILDFSKTVAGVVREGSNTVFDTGFRIAMAAHETLRLTGVNYVIDPKTPFIEFSKDKLAIDFLQFPRHTLKYKAGDCDDLSILYSALLQSVGVETAFITIPGHIFMAFALETPPDQAQRTFLNPEDLIIHNDKAWVPVEITKVQASFLEAWQTGARQWRDNAERDEANFYPMYESWQTYEPVGFLQEEINLSVPSRSEITGVYEKEMTRFINREISDRVSKLKEMIESSNQSPKQVNKLGVLYAKYGKMEDALAQFNSVQNEYLPALINVGNIHFLNGEIIEAVTVFESASKASENNPVIILQLARSFHELGRYDDSAVLYNRLKDLNPKLADQFSYLDLNREESTRAADAESVMQTVIWEEED